MTTFDEALAAIDAWRDTQVKDERWWWVNSAVEPSVERIGPGRWWVALTGPYGEQIDGYGPTPNAAIINLAARVGESADE